MRNIHIDRVLMNRVKRLLASARKDGSRNLMKSARWMINNSILFFSTTLFAIGSIQAAINLDRTRIILDADKPSVSITVTNDDRDRPFLAQAWLEDADGRKSNDMLVVLPPVQRIEPGASSLVRLVATRAAQRLPKDKESLFYFNLRGIPPRDNNANALQIALQTRIKLFYRPTSLRAKLGAVWQSKMILRRIADGYEINNPTPYYITVTGLKNRDGGYSNMTPLMMAPWSKSSLKAPRLDQPVISYINDYGGQPEIIFHCQKGTCYAKVQ